MEKKSLGWFILKIVIFGQLIFISVGALLIIFAGYEAKPTIIYFSVVSTLYWSVFGTLAYKFRNWVKVEKED